VHGAQLLLLACLPTTAGEPLLIDVASSLQRAKRHVDVVVGGRYGLGSKDFTPAMAMVSRSALALSSDRCPGFCRKRSSSDSPCGLFVTSVASASGLLLLKQASVVFEQPKLI
jgi:hypothetical protein